ncbi:hypothetical protein HBHAL_1659 [Halobacillus halophilus DSM 2266]|uniref:Uncharacterized protein n=1 Tax=Halobacillus halophilus (strain ATCC 35676 / DSM 2266 / JCM 20832 / KCTC 3685 / LMG 17431 / NBRC 102448 / NCIMB 2269) TaxID=866895 RepID=I0JIQ8_HALH3|nr:hypothetical protein [Halobacillus halophilus]CCG44026.1 hypothetical protein HBHAL_1659 [Halobacillus halophilus DSM 2266]
MDNFIITFYNSIRDWYFIDRSNKRFKQNRPDLTQNQIRAKEDTEQYKDMNQNNF